MGRLVRDPEVRYSQNKVCVARYTLAVDRPRKKGQDAETDFINCVCLGKVGEFAQLYLHQGMKMLICGRWQTGSYLNREGKKVYTNEVMVNEQHFCERREEGNFSPNESSSIGDGFVNVPDGVDDLGLPFD